jgi:hypothetical protein
LFESASGVETIFEIGVRLGASEKAKGMSEAFAVNQSSVDRRSERETEDIMRWEGDRASPSERRIEWERAAMEKWKGG